MTLKLMLSVSEMHQEILDFINKNSEYPYNITILLMLGLTSTQINSVDTLSSSTNSDSETHFFSLCGVLGEIRFNKR